MVLCIWASEAQPPLSVYCSHGLEKHWCLYIQRKSPIEAFPTSAVVSLIVNQHNYCDDNNKMHYRTVQEHARNRHTFKHTSKVSALCGPYVSLLVRNHRQLRCGSEIYVCIYIQWSSGLPNQENECVCVSAYIVHVSLI